MFNKDVFVGYIFIFSTVMMLNINANSEWIPCLRYV